MAEYYVYILISKKASKTYTGVSSNPKKRLGEHNSGSNVYTRKYRLWKLFYTEKFATKIEAMDKEKYYKSHAGRDEIRKMFGIQ